MGILNPILYFPSNDSLDHKSPISCLWTDLNIFFLGLEINGDSKSDIVLYLKWLTGPHKFVIMIRCKINFDIIIYSNICSLSILVNIRLIIWYIELRFMNVNILVITCFWVQIFGIQIVKIDFDLLEA